MTTQHTTTPFYVRDGHIANSDTGGVLSTEEILHLCNAHDDLVAALKLTLAEINRIADAPAKDFCEQHFDQETVAARNAACAALLKSEAL